MDPETLSTSHRTIRAGAVRISPQAERQRRELQSQLDALPENGHLTLIPGEYPGPFVIRHSITLLGAGAHTTLWRGQGPVLVIIVPGVNLVNLLIEQTILATGFAAADIVYLSGCQPVLNIITPASLRMQEMNSEKLIDLGLLSTAQSIKLPFELPEIANRPRTAKFGEFSPFFRVKDTTYNRPNIRTIWIEATLPGEDGLLYEQFAWVDAEAKGEDVNKNRDNYLIQAEVQNSIPDSPSSLALECDRFVLHFTNALEIGTEQVRIIESLVKKWKSSPNTAQLTLFKIGQNAWRLWIPGATPVGATIALNGEPLRSWTLRPLMAKDKIALGANDFEIVTNKTPPISINPSKPGNVVDLGMITSVNPQLIELEVERLGQREWVGKIESLVPWIVASDARITVKAKQNVIVKLATNFTRDMPIGVYQGIAGLVFYDAKEAVFVNLRADFALVDYSFQIDPPVLRFPYTTGETLYAKELAGARATISLSNQGRLPPTLKIVQKPDFLDISVTELRMDMPSAEIRVRLNKEANKFNAGVYNQTDMVEFECIETGERIGIGVEMVVSPPREPDIFIEALGGTQFAFDLAEEKLQPIVTDITLNNRGAVVGEFRFDTGASSGLVITSISGEVFPSMPVTIRVEVDKQLLKSAMPDTLLTYPLTIYTGAPGNLSTLQPTPVIKIKIVERRPELEVQIDRDDLGELSACGKIDEQSFRVKVRNIGNYIYVGELVAQLDWLTVNDYSKQLIRLDPKADTTVTIKTNSRFNDLPPGLYNEDCAFRFECRDRVPFHLEPYLPIKVTLQPCTPLILLRSEFLWFGRCELPTEIVQAQGFQYPHTELVIGNYGFADWEGSLENHAEWLDIPTQRLVIPAGTVLRLPITVNAQVTQIRSEARLQGGAYEQEQALTIYNADGSHDATFPANLPARIFMVEPPNYIEATQVSFMIMLNQSESWIGNKQYHPEAVSCESVVATLRNQGTQTVYLLHDTLTAPDWLIFDSMPTAIPAKSSAEVWFKLKVSEQEVTLERVVSGELRIALDGGEMLSIAASYQVVAPRIKYSPKIIVSKKGSTVIKSILQIINESDAPFKITRKRNEGNLIAPQYLMSQTKDDQPKTWFTVMLAPGESQSWKISLGSGTSPDPNSPLEITLKLPDHTAVVIPVMVQN